MKIRPKGFFKKIEVQKIMYWRLPITNRQSKHRMGYSLKPCFRPVYPIAVMRQHVGELHAVGWGESLSVLVSQVKPFGW